MELACVSCTQRKSRFKHKTQANSISLEACPRKPCMLRVKILVFLIEVLWEGGMVGGRGLLLATGGHGGVSLDASTAM